MVSAPEFETTEATAFTINETDPTGTAPTSLDVFVSPLFSPAPPPAASSAHQPVVRRPLLVYNNDPSHVDLTRGPSPRHLPPRRPSSCQGRSRETGLTNKSDEKGKRLFVFCKKQVSCHGMARVSLASAERESDEMPSLATYYLLRLRLVT